MEEKLSGIVLSAVNFGENDKILNIFTLEKGIISARCKGVKKAGAKLKFASEPFCFAEFIFSCSGDKRLVINASLIESFYPIRENILKFFSAGTMLEFVKKFAKEEMVSTQMFSLLVDGLKEIAYKDEDARLFLIRFIIKALNIVGYGLKTDGCFTCNSDIENRVFFDFMSGAFYCEKCFNGEGREISITTYKTISKIFIESVFEVENLVKCLKLLDFYILNKAEEKINSLSELIALN